MSEPDDSDRQLLQRISGYRRKRPYRAIFGNLDGNWRVEANWEDAYYGAAHAVISGVVEGRYLRAVEGVAGLYLFRHYLELALKYTILHSRWIKDQHTLSGAVKEIDKTHSLKRLWGLLKAEALPKMQEDDSVREWDIEFVEACVLEFDTVDPGQGERFRYHGKSFGGAQAGAGDERLWIDFGQLLENMAHVREVLGMVDLWFYETHGMIQEWEAEMDSW